MFTRLILCLSCVILCSASLSPQDRALNSLIDTFGDTSVELKRSVGRQGGVSASCSTGKVIIWGYTQYTSGNFGGNSVCSKNGKECAIGSTNCSIPSCPTGSAADISIVNIVCGNTILKDSESFGVTKTDGTYASASCTGNGKKILFGFTFGYGDSFGSCSASQFKSCTANTLGCTVPTCNNVYRPHNFVYIFCGSEVEAQALVAQAQYKTSVTAGQAVAHTCLNDAPNTLLGNTVIFADSYGVDATNKQIQFLQRENRLCTYNDASCDIDEYTGMAVSYGMAFGICVPNRRTMQPTVSTSPPTISTPQPSTSLSTKQPSTTVDDITIAPTTSPSTSNDEDSSNPSAVAIGAGVGSAVILFAFGALLCYSNNKLEVRESIVQAPQLTKPGLRMSTKRLMQKLSPFASPLFVENSDETKQLYGNMKDTTIQTMIDSEINHTPQPQASGRRKKKRTERHKTTGVASIAWDDV